MLQPVVRRTWSPRGQTPIHYSWDRHDRLSVISGLSVSPVRRRVGLYFRCHRHNIRHADVCDFFRHLLRHLRGHVIVWPASTIVSGGRQLLLPLW